MKLEGGKQIPLLSHLMIMWEAGLGEGEWRMKKGVPFVLFLALRPFLSSFLLDAGLVYPPRAGVCIKDSKTFPLLLESNSLTRYAGYYYYV